MQDNSFLDLEISRVVADFDHLVKDWIDIRLKENFGVNWKLHKPEGIETAVKEISLFTGKHETTIYRWFESLNKKNLLLHLDDYYNSQNRENSKHEKIESQIKRHEKKKEKAKEEYDSHETALKILYETATMMMKR